MQCRMEVGPMDHKVWRTKRSAEVRNQSRIANKLPSLPAAERYRLGLGYIICKIWIQSEVAQEACRVGRDLDAGTDLPESVS